MKRYIEHIKSTRTPHERRGHALQIAGGATLVIGIIWLATLGVRYGGAGDASQVAGAAQATDFTQNSLVVASSTGQ